MTSAWSALEPRGLVRLSALALALLLAACSNDRPTEPAVDALQPAEAATGAIRDDFTDDDGTPLLSHVPDGGTTPFSWLGTVWNEGEEEATIQANAVGATTGGNWVYVTSVEAGDQTEIGFELYREITTAQDVGFFIRTAEGNFNADGISVFWGISAGSNFVEVVEPNGGGSEFFPMPAPLAQGAHTLRSEIIGSRLDVYADGTRIISRTVSLPAARRTGIGLFRNADPDVRITSFSASSSAPAAFNVACTPSPVIRGSTVTCTASPPNTGDQFTISEWRFEGPDLPQPIVEASTSSTWPGIAATSGTVSVQGTIGGAPAGGSGPLTVAARTWGSGPDTVGFKITEVTPAALPARPTRVGELGNTAAIAGGSVRPDGFAQVPGGPNKGVLYVTTVPVEAESKVQINRVALSPNSDFYRLQPNKLKKTDPPDKCVRADVLPFLPKVEQHEGLHLEPNSHTFVFRRELNLNVAQAAEHVVSLGDVSELQARADAAAQPGIQAAAMKAADQINGGTVPPVPYCNFAFFPGP